MFSVRLGLAQEALTDRRGEVSVGADPWRKAMPGYSIWATLRTDESGSFSTRLPTNTYVAWARPGGS